MANFLAVRLFRLSRHTCHVITSLFADHEPTTIILEIATCGMYLAIRYVDAVMMRGHIFLDLGYA